MQRRNFVGALTAASAQRVSGANDRVRGAIIGSGGRGRYLTGEFKEIGVEMGGVCDVYEGNLRDGLKVASTGAKSFDNYKRVLDDKSFDIVVIATPDHWHAPMTIDAVQAGKDVYVEKPLAHTIDEGFRMIDAVRRTNRVVQVGMQRRSADLFIEAKRVHDTASIGDVRLVNSWWYNNQAGINTRKLEGKVDWQQWLGSAPKRDLDPARFFNWYYYWDYSGGLMIGQAAHMVDAINWMMDSKYPAAVTTSAIRPNLPGVEVPETTTMCIEYPENYMTVFTVGYKAMRYASFLDQLAQVHGSKARFDFGREHYAVYPEDPKALELQPSIEKKAPGSFSSAPRQHIRNFLDCVRSRKQPNATVQIAQYTNVALCLAMDSLRQGRRMTYEGVR